MIYENPPLSKLSEKHYDICIIGSGPAGIVLALELSKAGKSIALIEAGGYEYTDDSQAFYDGDQTGQPYLPLDAPRLRYFGGGSGHWTGRCILMDEYDFLPREDVPLSGWPIRKSDIEPYQAKAADYIGCRDFSYHRRVADAEAKTEFIEQQMSAMREIYDVHDLRESDSRRFGTYYRDDVRNAENLDCFLNVTFLEFEIDRETGRATGAKLRKMEPGEGSVTADTFVMAMGGLENTRSLLLQNRSFDNRLGNQGDMVGRCFMEHPLVFSGYYFLTKRLYSHMRYWEFERLFGRLAPQLNISPNHERIKDLGILNSALRLDRIRRKPLSERVMADVPFIKDLVFDDDYFFTGTTEAISEQAPNPNSRLTLADWSDDFGQPAAHLHLELSDIDFKTLRQVSLEGATYLARTGLGRMQMDPALWSLDDPSEVDVHWSSHNIGGARMSETPETGVVDKNCRIHGTENIYVGGSAIFPTGGLANPTFTIVQLALRLSDHLKTL